MKDNLVTLKPLKRKPIGNPPAPYDPDELRRTLHDMMNQLTVVNLTCFKLRKSCAREFASAALAEIERMERSAEELIDLSEKLTEQFMLLMPRQRSHRQPRAPKAGTHDGKVYRLFK